MALSEALEKEHKEKLSRIREEISSLEDDIHAIVDYIKECNFDYAINDMHGIIDELQGYIRCLIQVRNLETELGNYVPPS